MTNKNWSPRHDIAFQALFLEQKNLLIDFVNATLKEDHNDTIIDVAVLNPGHRATDQHHKIPRLDLKALSISNKLYHIEIQLRRYTEGDKPLTFLHNFSVFSDQELEPFTGIIINDYPENDFIQPKYHLIVALFDVSDPNSKPILVEDSCRIHILQLNQLSAFAPQEVDNYKQIELWGHFFNVDNNAQKELLRTKTTFRTSPGYMGHIEQR